MESWKENPHGYVDNASLDKLCKKEKNNKTVDQLHSQIIPEPPVPLVEHYPHSYPGTYWSTPTVTPRKIKAIKCPRRLSVEMKSA